MLSLQRDCLPTHPTMHNTSTFMDILLNENAQSLKRNVIKLKEMLMRANALVLEANYLAAEMKRDVNFSVNLQISASSINLTHSKDEPRCEPVVVVNRKYLGRSSVWSMEKFEDRMVEMREKYSDFTLRGSSHLRLGLDENDDPFTETPASHELIGVANIIMSCLLYDVRFSYPAPIINVHGETVGRLRIELQRINGIDFQEQNLPDSDDSTSANKAETHLLIKVTIRDARELPQSLANFVFCQFRFWDHFEPVVVPPKMIKDPKQFAKLRKRRILPFNHEVTFKIKPTSEFTEFCSQNGSLSVEVYGHQPKHEDVPVAERYLVDRKIQNLISQWNEVKCLLVLWVEVHELTESGIWTPVHLIQDSRAPAAGGVFKIRQGQSNRIVVHVRRIKSPNSLPLVIDKISSIEVGSVRCCKPPVSIHLDSYQDNDLNVLRACWLDVVSRRRTYLESELKNIEMRSETDESGYSKEREQNLIDQLIHLTDERNAVELPLPGSGIPGAPADWIPPTGMEKHIPIIFLNLDNSKPSKIDTRITEEDSNDEYFVLPLIFSTEESAVAQWDPALHESSCFNQLTPSDSFVFVIVKITVNISEPIKTTLVLRKRVAIQVIRRVNNWSERLIKRILGDAEQNLRAVGVTYEIVSHLPFALHEHETRESLAKIAANPESSNTLYIEQYLKSVQTLDAVLKLDQLRQEIALKDMLRSDNNDRHHLSSPELEVSENLNFLSESKNNNEKPNSDMLKRESSDHFRLAFDVSPTSTSNIETDASGTLKRNDTLIEQEKRNSNLLLFDQSPVLLHENNSCSDVIRSRRSKIDYETCPDWIKLSTQVIVSTSSVVNKLGVVRFIGHTCFKPGIWIGVELDLPCGKNDGSFDGIKYFDCLKNHGVFVRHDKLTKYVPADWTSEKR